MRAKINRIRRAALAVPISFWQCENRSVPECYKKRARGATPLSSPPKRLIERGFDMRLVCLIAFLLATSPVAAQTPGTSTSQTCTQDPAYCSDTGATPSTTTGSGTSGSASGSGSSGGSSSGGSSGSGSSGVGAGGPLSIPNAPCGDGFPIDAWGDCN